MDILTASCVPMEDIPRFPPFSEPLSPALISQSKANKGRDFPGRLGTEKHFSMVARIIDFHPLPTSN